VSRVSLATFFVWIVVGLAGCATVAGLESIQESPCPFGCDGSADDDGSTDSTVNAADTSSADTRSSADTAAADGSVDVVDTDNFAHVPDGSRSDATEDAPSSEADTGASDGNAKADAHDGAVGSDAEAGAHDGSAADAKSDVDSGCGPLNTVTNCGACGVACPAAGDNAGVGTAMCTGTTCQYTCSAGYLDCNASVAPDTDGCECAWSGPIAATCCMGNACPSPHLTGFANGPSGASQTFYDCETMVTLKLAMDACIAYSGDQMYCAATSCGASTTNTVVCNLTSPVSQDDVCWGFSGTGAGWVYDAGPYPNLFRCPSGGGAGEVQYH
jgi:hypothetical protein